MDLPGLTLVGFSGPYTDQRFTFQGTARIGSGPENEIVLGDASISPSHARLYYEGGRWWLEDEGSRAGTFVVVNGEMHRVEESASVDDVMAIYIGDAGFRLTGESAPRHPEVDQQWRQHVLRIDYDGQAVSLHLAAEHPLPVFHRCDLSRAQLRAWIQRLRQAAALSAQEEGAGESIDFLMGEFARLYLSPVLLEALAASRDSLLILHDAELAALPWETLDLGDTALGIFRPVCRKVRGTHEVWKTHASGTELLFCGGPGCVGDAPARLEELASEMAPVADVVLLRGENALAAQVLKGLGRARAAVLAGFALRDDGTLTTCDGAITLEAIGALRRLPKVVLLLNCQSDSSQGEMQLASALSLMGVQSVAGLWEVGGAAGCSFASVFLEEVWREQAIDAAVREARQACRIHAPQSPCWGAFALFGTPGRRL